MLIPKTKYTLALLIAFICILKAPVAYTQPVNQGGDTKMNEENAEDVDDTRLEFKTQTSLVEKQQPSELESDYEESLEELKAQPQQESNESADTQLDDKVKTLLAEKQRLSELESQFKKTLGDSAAQPQQESDEVVVVDDAQLEEKARTLLIERQRLSELESEYEESVENIETQRQEEENQEEYSEEDDVQAETPAPTPSNEEEQQQQPSVPEVKNTDKVSKVEDSKLRDLLKQLSDEKEQLSKLEWNYKNKFDETMLKAQQSVSEEEDTQSEEHLLTTLRDKTIDATSRDETYAQIIAKDLKPEGNVDYIGTADGLYKLSQYEESLLVYQSINTEGADKRDSAWILYQIANCYRNLKQFEKASNTFQELQATYPSTYLGREARWYLEDTAWWLRWHETATNTIGTRGLTENPLPPINAEGK